MITHFTTETTSQELFDYVTNFMFVQGGPSLDKHGTKARYRGHNNRMCAFGCIIPDEIYTPEMEGKSAEALILRPTEVGLYFDANAAAFFEALKPHVELIKNLQATHDSQSYAIAHSELFLRESFKHIAITFNLNYETPDFVKFRI